MIAPVPTENNAHYKGKGRIVLVGTILFLMLGTGFTFTLIPHKCHHYSQNLWNYPMAAEFQAISCDVVDGQVFPSGNPVLINWTAKGYPSYRFALFEDGVKQNFGPIYSDEFTITQEVESSEGVVLCEIIIYIGDQTVEKESVHVQIIQGWWEKNWRLIGAIAVGSAVGVSVTVLWRTRVKNKARKRDQGAATLTRFKNGKQLKDFLEVTSSPEEEKHATFLSSSRMLKVWIFFYEESQFVYSETINPLSLNKDRDLEIDRELQQYLEINEKAVQNFSEGTFVKIFGMIQGEAMFLSPQDPGYCFAFLFRGKVTNSYLNKITKFIDSVSSRLEKGGSLGNWSSWELQELLENQLHYERSRCFVEPTETKIKQLESFFDGLPPNIDEFIEDIQGLTIGDCNWLLAKKEEQARGVDLEPLFEIVEDLG